MAGIDLGTSNSAIAHVKDGQPRIIKPGTEDVMPSVVFMDKAGVITVGADAITKLLTAKEQDGTGHSRWKTRMGQDDRYEFTAAKKTLSGPQLSSLVIKRLLNAYRHHQKEELTSCVITIPAKFDQPANDATREAARLAGLEHHPTLQEPIAAALAYGFSSTDNRANWMVFDLGGGTLDVSLMIVRDGNLTVLEEGQAGDTYLGGSIFDRELLDFVLGPPAGDALKYERYRKLQTGYEPLRKKYKLENFSQKTNRDAWQRLLAKVETAKIELSNDDEARVKLDVPLCKDESGKDVMVDVLVTREAYETLIAADVERAAHICQTLLSRNRMSSKDLDQLILVGGPTKTPYVQSVLANRLQMDVKPLVDPMTAVALGAAVFSETVEVPGGRKSRPVRTALGIHINLQSERASKLDHCTVAGCVSGDNVDPTQLLVKLVREDGRWASDQIPLDEVGMFEMVVNLVNAGRPHETRFTTYVLDRSGTELASVDEPAIWYPFPESRAPLSNTLSVALVNNETLPLLKQGVMLPGKNRGTVKTTKALRRGATDEVLTIPIVEGVENLLGNEMVDRSDCNVHIGQLRVHGADKGLTRDLPKGAEVEIVLSVDNSRKIVVTAIVPALDDEEFSAELKSEPYGIDVELVEQRLDDEERRLKQVRLLHAIKPCDLVARALTAIDKPNAVESIKTDLERAKRGEESMLGRVWKRLLALSGTIYEAWDEQMLTRLTQQLEQMSKAAANEEQGDVEALGRELRSAGASREQLAKLEREAAALDIKIRHRPFFTLLLYVLALSGIRVTREQNEAHKAAGELADELIDRGAPDTLTTDDIARINAVNKRIVDLYDELQDHIDKWREENPGRESTLVSDVERR